MAKSKEEDTEWEREREDKHTHIQKEPKERLFWMNPNGLRTDIVHKKVIIGESRGSNDSNALNAHAQFIHLQILVHSFVRLLFVCRELNQREFKHFGKLSNIATSRQSWISFPQQSIYTANEKFGRRRRFIDNFFPCYSAFEL